MASCSNARCLKPKPGSESRCLSCQALLTDVLVRHRYEIKQTVGRGGFGTTYLTKDQDRFNEPCILKELNSRPLGEIGLDTTDNQFDDTAERLFRREAQVLLSLEHPGIPNLHAYFSENGYSYLVQDYIPGYTLADEVNTKKRTFDEKEARALLLELADILEYLHSRTPPIIHRDIKPQNLMRHSRGRLLLIDFGAVCHAANYTGKTLIGSPGYAPPEQILGQSVPQSDLYAAGATALRLLTGLHPSQLFNHRAQQIEWTSRVKVSDQFAAIINDLMVQDFSKRLPSAKLLKQRLNEIAAEPALALVKPIKENEPDLATSLHQQRATQDFQIAAESNLLSNDQQFNTARLADEVGNLEQMSILLLLQRFYRERITGELICSKGALVKTIYFDHGSIVFANSTLNSERLGDMLIRIGRISIAEYQQATNLMHHKSIRFGAALVELGYLPLAELRALIIVQVSNIIYSLFEWTTGQYGIRRRPTHEESIKISISTADIIFEGLRRIENIDIIKSWLGDFTRKLTLTNDPLLLYQVINLDPKEAFIVSRIDSVMSIEEILSLGGLPEAETLKTLCGLIATGILERVVTAQKPMRPSRSELTLASILIGPTALPASFDQQTAATFCYEVENFLNVNSKANHYAVLGVMRTANEDELCEQYIQLAKKFHPDRHMQIINYNPSLQNKLEQIFTTISAAYNTLKDPQMRAAYNDSLRNSGEAGLG